MPITRSEKIVRSSRFTFIPYTFTCQEVPVLDQAGQPIFVDEVKQVKNVIRKSIGLEVLRRMQLRHKELRNKNFNWIIPPIACDDGILFVYEQMWDDVSEEEPEPISEE